MPRSANVRPQDDHTYSCKSCAINSSLSTKSPFPVINNSNYYSNDNISPAINDAQGERHDKVICVNYSNSVSLGQLSDELNEARHDALNSPVDLKYDDDDDDVPPLVPTIALNIEQSEDDDDNTICCS